LTGLTEPDLEDLASLVLCFEIESCGLRLAALTVLPAEAVGIPDVDGWFVREDSAKIRRCHCRLTARTGFI
jgi:hypothetical protein